mmetsp:Transcript_127695/g.310460  ORF Transcript_127695/g.310460 Transcript_127695/m.310460 type:complete len:208 (+) Transcript_127695:2014-2637(+)
MLNCCKNAAACGINPSSDRANHDSPMSCMKGLVNEGHTVHMAGGVDKVQVGPAGPLRVDVVVAREVPAGLSHVSLQEPLLVGEALAAGVHVAEVEEGRTDLRLPRAVAANDRQDAAALCGLAVHCCPPSKPTPAARCLYCRTAEPTGDGQGRGHSGSGSCPRAPQASRRGRLSRGRSGARRPGPRSGDHRDWGLCPERAASCLETAT